MPTRRHDHDAGGSAELLAAKAELRNEVWAALRAARATRFPGPEGRIPNFVGAEAAAERLRGTDAWRAAATLKANPDSPQWPVRQRALEDGKLVFMAVLAAVTPLTQPRAQRVRLDRQAAGWLVRGLDSRLAGTGPAHPVSVRRPADHHQVGVGDNLRPGV